MKNKSVILLYEIVISNVKNYSLLHANVNSFFHITK